MEDKKIIVGGKEYDLDYVKDCIEYVEINDPFKQFLSHLNFCGFENSGEVFSKMVKDENKKSILESSFNDVIYSSYNYPIHIDFVIITLEKILIEHAEDFSEEEIYIFTHLIKCYNEFGAQHYS